MWAVLLCTRKKVTLPSRFSWDRRVKVRGTQLFIRAIAIGINTQATRIKQDINIDRR